MKDLVVFVLFFMTYPVGIKFCYVWWM